MKKLLVISCCFILLCVIATAADIRGVVTDSSSLPLPGATARLLSAKDSTQKAFGVTDADGAFSLKTSNPGKYIASVTMIGLDDLNIPIEVSEKDTLIDLGQLKMYENSVTLKEAVVTAVKAAVVSKEDTLEFNAGSYRVQPNASVEDLLKKLPGVEVGSDGSIKSNGKTISKILVDGKEFFGDDPTMASKNLPSDVVDKIQVVDRKSDLARLTGVDDGEEETVINLTVKKSMQNGWFGTISGGGGTDSRYEGSFNISTFTDGQQISIVGGANNINEMGFADAGRGRFMNFGPSGGITTAQRFGINFNLGKTDDLRFGGNIFYTHSDRKAISASERQFLYPDSTSYQSQGSTSRDKGHNLRGDFRLQWKIDENNTIDFRPGFSLNLRNSELNDTSVLRSGDELRSLVNSNETRRFNNGVSWNATGNLIFNHNFASRPGRSFSINARYQFSNTRQRTTTWNDILYYMRHEDDELLYRYLDGCQWSNTVEGRFTWTEPLGDAANGNFLQFAYRINYRFNNADKDTYSLPSDGVDFPDDYREIPADGIWSQDLSNRFRNTFSTQELRIGYKKVSKKYNLEAGVEVSPSSTSSDDLINDARDIPTRWVWNVAPYARFRYKFSKTMALRANYRARTSQPSISQLQPVADVSDPLSVTIGNPDLKPTFTQSIGIHFNNYNAERQQSIFAMLRGEYSNNVVVSRTVSDPSTGGRTTTYSNADGNGMVSGMVMMNQPFRNPKWRYSVQFFGNFNSSAGYINGDFNRAGNLRVAPTFGLTFSTGPLQVSARPKYSFSMVTNTLPQQKNRYTHTYGFTADLALNFDFGLSLNTDIAYDKSTGYSAGFNTSQWNWNAEIAYSVLRDKSLTFSVRAYDILGQVKNISRSVSADMITDSRYNDLTRYVMFGVSWTFNTMKGKKSDNLEGMPGPPDGPRHGGSGPAGPPPGGFGGRPPRM